MLGRDDAAAAGDGDEHIAYLRGIAHGHNLVSVHDRFKRTDRVSLGDDDLCAESLCAQADALAAPSVAGDDNVFARYDEVCRTHDAVPDALTRAVAVVEHVLAVGFVDHDHREAQLARAIHCLQAVDTGRCLLAAADDLRDEVGILRVHEVDQVAAVINNNIGRGFKHRAQAAFVFLHIAAVARKHLHPARGESGGDIVLRGERIRAGNIHLCSTHFHDAAEVSGFRLEMHRQSDSQPRERLCAAEILADAAQNGHVSLHPFDFHLTRRRKSYIFYSAHCVTSRKHQIKTKYFNTPPLH